MTDRHRPQRRIGTAPPSRDNDRLPVAIHCVTPAMKSELSALLRDALATLTGNGVLPPGVAAQPRVEHTKNRAHGDFSTNLAMVLAKPAGQPPRVIAEAIVAALPTAAWLRAVTIAGPGFINFTLQADARWTVIGEILRAGEAFGRSDFGQGQPVQVEFVSANPTGPLHVGHGRGAAYGATVANLLEAVGFAVQREYYVNDAGRQMDILATSVWLRYLELGGIAFAFPSNGYQGDYVQDIAAALRREHGDRFELAAARLMADIPADEPDGGDKEAHIDALIERARTSLGPQAYRQIADKTLHVMVADIRDDLSRFGVTFDRWYSERSLVDSDAIDAVLQRLRARGHLYQRQGACWFRSSAFGDEKDRVVVRDNGQPTYFASDIAYHLEKLTRGFAVVIDVWGADHHGYAPRVKAALQAMGEDPQRLQVLLVQFANLYQGGERVPMSTRSGSFVTLRQLRKAVGKDAARFFYVMRRCEQHLDFDMDLAMSQSNENPVYYIQYAHARVASVLRQAAAAGVTHDTAAAAAHLDRLGSSYETALADRLARYPGCVRSAAETREPHQLAHYLRDLANDFHTYYNASKFLADDAGLRDARLNLILAVQQVLRNGLRLLGVAAPERM